MDVDKEGISLAVIDDRNNAISVEKRIRNDNVSLLKSLKRLRTGTEDVLRSRSLWIRYQTAS